MNTKESSLSTAFRRCIMKRWPRAHYVRIENAVELGTPDVSLCLPGGWHPDAIGTVAVPSVETWVELKVATMPVRATTKVSVDHFTNEQRAWLVSRYKAGGRCYVLVQVGECYLLLRGEIAAVKLGFVPFGDLVALAVASGTSLDDAVAGLVGC